jgi:hypothetical protein
MPSGVYSYSVVVYNLTLRLKAHSKARRSLISGDCDEMSGGLFLKGHYFLILGRV